MWLIKTPQLERTVRLTEKKTTFHQFHICLWQNDPLPNFAFSQSVRASYWMYQYQILLVHKYAVCNLKQTTETACTNQQ